MEGLIFNELFWRGLERHRLFRDIPDSFAERILCAISEPVLIFDENRHICGVNPAAEILLGHSSGFLQGKKCSQIFSNPECASFCPVEKAFETGEDQTCAVKSLLYAARLLETIPYGRNVTRFVLSIIHPAEEKDRLETLRRDLAAALNRRTTLEEAAEDILASMENLASIRRKGIYTGAGNKLALLEGTGVPSSISRLADKAGYFSTENLSEEEQEGFPDGIALIPVTGSSGRPGVFLAAGRGRWGSESRRILELIAEVLSSCIDRLVSGAF